MDTAPLLEEEGNIFLATGRKNPLNPFPLHGSGAMAAFSADNHPIDTGDFDVADILKQRFNGKKLDGRRR